MVIRAIHIEVIEELSSSSFIYALKRMIAFRGPVKEILSDQGTNFVGAANELVLDKIMLTKGSQKQAMSLL